ncbi:alkaline phosphatase family protein [Streptomyces sp. NPDC057565]|uniref:alkaline phosphatase family protein n=1 Tax=Streptomyces sp. NPDC057565 TaxID=3346169 RepID=UPI0036A940AD
MDDIRHVVILMRENRSFDHCCGTSNGVRGFDDRQALTFPNGDSVFRQPALSRPDRGFLLPFRVDSTNFNAQNADGLPHDWESGHKAISNGALNR